MSRLTKLRKQVLFYKVLEVIFLFASLIFIGMALCLLIYSEHLCCDKGSDWVRWFIYSIASMTFFIIVSSIREQCEKDIEILSIDINYYFKFKR